MTNKRAINMYKNRETDRKNNFLEDGRNQGPLLEVHAQEAKVSSILYTVQ